MCLPLDSCCGEKDSGWTSGAVCSDDWSMPRRAPCFGGEVRQPEVRSWKECNGSPPCEAVLPLFSMSAIVGAGGRCRRASREARSGQVLASGTECLCVLIPASNKTGQIVSRLAALLNLLLSLHNNDTFQPLKRILLLFSSSATRCE